MTLKQFEQLLIDWCEITHYDFCEKYTEQREWDDRKINIIKNKMIKYLKPSTLEQYVKEYNRKYYNLHNS